MAASGSFPVTTPSPDLDKDALAVQIAWSAQAAVESIVPALVRHARAITDLDAICLAGGVALNCSTNGLLADPIYVPPVSADAGAALGAAWGVAPPPAPLAPLSPYLASRWRRRRRRQRVGPTRAPSKQARSSSGSFATRSAP